jgi:2,4-dienoyl-CoA reductase-like NADH-dependent reductase (Old Yellow Enzyme family)
VLNAMSDLSSFRDLAEHGSQNNTQVWLQLGHAGALAYAPISTPKGPSALDLPGLQCAAMTQD